MHTLWSRKDFFGYRTWWFTLYENASHVFYLCLLLMDSWLHSMWFAFQSNLLCKYAGWRKGYSLIEDHTFIWVCFSLIDYHTVMWSSFHCILLYKYAGWREGYSLVRSHCFLTCFSKPWNSSSYQEHMANLVLLAKLLV